MSNAEVRDCTQRIPSQSTLSITIRSGGTSTLASGLKQSQVIAKIRRRALCARERRPSVVQAVSGGTGGVFACAIYGHSPVLQSDALPCRLLESPLLAGTQRRPARKHRSRQQDGTLRRDVEAHQPVGSQAASDAIEQQPLQPTARYVRKVER